MAVYLATLIDQFRELLDDETDTQVPFTRKVRFINRGQSAMFPSIYTLTSSVIETADDDYEYNLTIAAQGKIISVEIESEEDSGLYGRFTDYDIIPASHGTPILKLHRDPAGALNIRVVAAVPLTPFASANYAAAGSEAYTGPEYTLELPVLYGMSHASIATLDQRLDYGRYSVQNQNNAATPVDLMGAATYWMDLFRERLAAHAMPLPSAFV